MSSEIPGGTPPRADVLAEEYRGRYLWDELDKAKARIADLEEQLQAARRENVQLGDELGSVALHVETLRGEIRRALASLALEFYAGSRGQTAEILRAAVSSPASAPRVEIEFLPGSLPPGDPAYPATERES